MYNLLPPGHAVYRLVEVDGRMRAERLLGDAAHVVHPRDPFGTLLEMFRRPFPVGEHTLAFVADGTRVLGFVVAPRGEVVREALAREVLLQSREPAASGPVLALVDPGGEVLSARGEPGGDPLVPRAISQILGHPAARTAEGWWVEIELLQGAGGRIDLLARLEPASAVPLPVFVELTPSEARVCVLAGQGYRVREAAEAIGCHPETVRSHLRGIYAKLGISTRAELAPFTRELERWSEEIFHELASQVRRRRAPAESSCGIH